MKFTRIKKPKNLKDRKIRYFKGSHYIENSDHRYENKIITNKYEVINIEKITRKIKLKEQLKI